MATVLSADRENDPDVLGHDRRQRRAARLAHPVPASRTAAVRLGRVNGQLVVMPTHHRRWRRATST